MKAALKQIEDKNYKSALAAEGIGEDRIRTFATAPALVVVGFLMITSVARINFEDYTEAIPAYIAIIAMPLMYSISEGISWLWRPRRSGFQGCQTGPQIKTRT